MSSRPEFNIFDISWKFDQNNFLTYTVSGILPFTIVIKILTVYASYF